MKMKVLMKNNLSTQKQKSDNMQVQQINLHNLMSSTEFQKKVNYIRGIGEQRLYEAIWDNLYMSYSPKYYERTYQLLNSVSSSVKFNTTSFEIKVFCDSEKMDHFSVVDGQPTYVGGLMNYGFSWNGWEDTTPDYFHNRPESKFLETAMKKIQGDMQKMLLEAVVVAFNSNRYR